MNDVKRIAPWDELLTDEFCQKHGVYSVLVAWETWMQQQPDCSGVSAEELFEHIEKLPFGGIALWQIMELACAKAAEMAVDQPLIVEKAS